VLEGRGRAAERASGAGRGLCASFAARRRLGPTRALPVADIVRFQLLTLDLADARGVDPDKIHRGRPRWEKQRASEANE